jgi:hypothetical protein
MRARVSTSESARKCIIQIGAHNAHNIELSGIPRFSPHVPVQHIWTYPPVLYDILDVGSNDLLGFIPFSGPFRLHKLVFKQVDCM